MSPGLSVVIPDAFFPEMVAGDKAKHPWPYLRREVDHNWYCDRRSPWIGFLNRDEAVLLHNLALQFRGRSGIEIGCWMGWSTCHLALAGIELDVVDPALSNPEITSSVRSSLDAAGVLGQVHLYPTSSPDGVRELARLSGVHWNFFFIDGDHNAPAPELDVRECLEHAAPDALFVFHDLTSPDVAKALEILWQEGWHVLLYQTMQIMGVAWRGRARPVDHTPDPSIAWSLPGHLARYPVSRGSTREERAQR